MKFNQCQELVVKHYCGGEFSEIESNQQINGCGDTLFVFLMREAQDASDPTEFFGMLETAMGQIAEVQRNLP
jgi:hypothetical protein